MTALVPLNLDPVAARPLDAARLIERWRGPQPADSPRL